MSEERNDPTPVQEEGFNREEINARLIGGLTLGTVLFVLASIAGLHFYVEQDYEQQVYVKVLEPVSAELSDLRAREDEQLGSYKYIDREKGTVNLPIERAMELLAAEYESGSLKYPTTPYPVKSEEDAAQAQ